MSWSKEKQKEYMKKYREDNREKLLSFYKQYYLDNKEEMQKRNNAFKHSNPERVLWQSAKERAIKFNVPFSILTSDIIIPDECPILKIPLYKIGGKPSANSPSLDRIIPEIGYVIGNIQVISYKANTMKSNASFDELIMFSFWVMENLID